MTTTLDTIPTTETAPAAPQIERVAAEAPKAEAPRAKVDGSQRRRRRGGRGRRRDGQRQQAAPRPQQNRGPREKATIAGRLALAQADGDQERIGRLNELAAWKTRLEAIAASESRSAIAEAVRDLREYFADEMTAQRQYRDADAALRAAEATRDDGLLAALESEDPKAAASALAKAVRKAEAAKHEAVRLVREHSVGLDLYYELLRVLPPPPSRDERHGNRDQGERRNADRPRGNDGNRPRGGKQIAGQAAPFNGGLSAGLEQRNRELLAREAKAAEAQRKTDETPKGPAVERLQIEGLGGLTANGVFHMPDANPAPAPVN